MANLNAINTFYMIVGRGRYELRAATNFVMPKKVNNSAVEVLGHFGPQKAITLFNFTLLLFGFLNWSILFELSFHSLFRLLFTLTRARSLVRSHDAPVRARGGSHCATDHPFRFGICI